MRYIENIVIGYPIYPLKELISDGTNADYEQEYEKTYFTRKRNLAAILKDIGVVQSVNEVRRNKPEPKSGSTGRGFIRIFMTLYLKARSKKECLHERKSVQYYSNSFGKR